MIQHTPYGYLDLPEPVYVLPDNGRYDPALKGRITFKEIREFLGAPYLHPDGTLMDFQPQHGWGRWRLWDVVRKIPWRNTAPDTHGPYCTCRTCDF